MQGQSSKTEETGVGYVGGQVGGGGTLTYETFGGSKEGQGLEKGKRESGWQ